MSWAKSDLDFAVVDRAKTLGDLLRLLFAMMEEFYPRGVADLLTKFDGRVVVDPETAGRWLRDERRPSKQHLRLIVRLLQHRGLMGTPPARDRLFIRIAAFYAKLEAPSQTTFIPPASIVPPRRQLTAHRPRRPPPAMGTRFRALREDYELALALQFDLRYPGESMPRFDARRRKPRPFFHSAFD